MAALTQARMQRETTLKKVALPLVAGAKAFQGGMACIDTSAAVVRPGVAGNANLVKVGEFNESVDNSAGTGTTLVMVNLDREIIGRWYDNATGGNAATSSNLFQDVYVLDDHTITTSSSGNSKAGRMWGLDAVKGVLVVSLPDSI